MELEPLLKEKYRINQCLHVCRQISESINRGQSTIVLDGALAAYNTRHTPITTLDNNLTADETTYHFLKCFSLDTSETSSKLEQSGRFVQDKLKYYPAVTVKELDEIVTECCQKRNKRDALVGCLSVCENASQRSEQARANVFEDVHAAERAKQFAISDVGDLISI